MQKQLILMACLVGLAGCAGTRIDLLEDLDAIFSERGLTMQLLAIVILFIWCSYMWPRATFSLIGIAIGTVVLFFVGSAALDGARWVVDGVREYQAEWAERERTERQQAYRAYVEAHKAEWSRCELPLDRLRAAGCL